MNRRQFIKSVAGAVAVASLPKIPGGEYANTVTLGDIVDADIVQTGYGFIEGDTVIGASSRATGRIASIDWVEKVIKIETDVGQFLVDEEYRINGKV